MTNKKPHSYEIFYFDLKSKPVLIEQQNYKPYYMNLYTETMSVINFIMVSTVTIILMHIYTCAYNVLDFNAGSLTVTKVTEEDVKKMAEYPGL